MKRTFCSNSGAYQPSLPSELILIRSLRTILRKKSLLTIALILLLGLFSGKFVYGEGLAAGGHQSSAATNPAPTAGWRDLPDGHLVFHRGKASHGDPGPLESMEEMERGALADAEAAAAVSLNKLLEKDFGGWLIGIDSSYELKNLYGKYGLVPITSARGCGVQLFLVRADTSILEIKCVDGANAQVSDRGSHGSTIEIKSPLGRTLLLKLKKVDFNGDLLQGYERVDNPYFPNIFRKSKDGTFYKLIHSPLTEDQKRRFLEFSE